MYDYNFEERLTQKRLTFLLLSLVIPTDNYILKNIYNKKRELEVEEYHKGAQVAITVTKPIARSWVTKPIARSWNLACLFFMALSAKVEVEKRREGHPQRLS